MLDARKSFTAEDAENSEILFLTADFADSYFAQGYEGQVTRILVEKRIFLLRYRMLRGLDLSLRGIVIWNKALRFEKSENNCLGIQKGKNIF